MTTKSFEGELSAGGFKFGLVVSRFNSLITERLLEGAMDCLRRHGASDENIEIVRVPGTWEMPVAMTWMVDHPGEARAMGERARQATVDKYHWEPEATRLLDLYGRLLDT